MAPWLARDAFLSKSIDTDGSLQKTLAGKNEEELKRLDEKIADAEQNHGETELSDALRAKASYIAKIGETVRAGSPLNRNDEGRALTYVVVPGQGIRGVRAGIEQAGGAGKQD